jgi:hypothetical protein
MSQPTEQGASPEPTAQKRPGKRDGQANEATFIFPLKPGGAEMVREAVKYRDEHRGARTAIDTIHDVRTVLIDNDTRMLFCTTFDGDWDSYIDDFLSKVPRILEVLFSPCEGYPGIGNPDVTKDWAAKHQITALEFNSAYPDATVTQIRKGQRVLKAWEELLDTAAE